MHRARKSAVLAAISLLSVGAATARPAAAQGARGNADLIGNSGLIDSILATPNRKTPVPQDNDFATAPGVEQPTPTPAPRSTPNVPAQREGDRP